MRIIATTVGGSVTEPLVGCEWRDARFDGHGYFAAARIDSYRGGKPYTLGLCPVPKRTLSAIDLADHVFVLAQDLKQRWPLRRATGVVMLDLEAVMFRPYAGKEEDAALGLIERWVRAYLDAFAVIRPGLLPIVYNAAPGNMSLYVRRPCSPPGVDQAGRPSYAERVAEVARIAGSHETVNFWLKYHEHSGRFGEWLDDHEVSAVFDAIEALPPRHLDGRPLTEGGDADGKRLPCRPRAMLYWHNIVDAAELAALRKYAERDGGWWDRIARLRDAGAGGGPVPATVATSAGTTTSVLHAPASAD